MRIQLGTSPKPIIYRVKLAEGCDEKLMDRGACPKVIARLSYVTEGGRLPEIRALR